MSAAEADNALSELETDFSVLSDTDGIYLTWRALVAGLGVLGKQVHDTRLVASCSPMESRICSPSMSPISLASRPCRQDWDRASPS